MFKFSIRDVLWLTAVVALAVCWWKARVESVKATAEAAQLKREVETWQERAEFLAKWYRKRGGSVVWSDDETGVYLGIGTKVYVGEAGREPLKPPAN